MLTTMQAVENLRRQIYAASEPISIDAPIAADDGDDLSMLEIIPAPTPTPYQLVERDEMARRVRRGLEMMPPRLGLLLVARYGVRVSWPLARIGAALGVSKQRTAVLERDALRAMREAIR